MKFRSPLLVPLCALVFGITGCQSLKTGQSEARPLESVRLQLMDATITRDDIAIQALLAPDFAWREDDAPLSETAFLFWDRQRLWGVLHELLKEPTAAKGDMKVAPKKSLRDSYTGPRLAWRKVGDEWRLAYFYAGTLPSGSPPSNP